MFTWWKGIQYYPNGKIEYEGDFLDDKKEGNGKHYFEDGSYEIGQWKNDLQEGNFKQYDKNGKEIGAKTYENGRWIHGTDEFILIEN